MHLYGIINGDIKYQLTYVTYDLIVYDIVNDMITNVTEEVISCNETIIFD